MSDGIPLSQLATARAPVPQAAAAPSSPPTVTAAEFFETVPPGQRVRIVGWAEWSGRRNEADLQFPRLTLHCASEKCGGPREFDPSARSMNLDDYRLAFVRYECRNCESTTKIYAARFKLVGDSGPDVYATKFGEEPAFGPPVPARVSTLVGSERDYYFKGTRSENQGLGIAAFAYYRRVVENRKNAIIGEIRRVAAKLSAPQELLDQLDEAVKETQFSSAVGMIKHGIPASLLINGHNPLSILHEALSEGLHAQTDAECLELATHIRVVLAEFVERVATTLKDDAALNAAVSRLMSKRQPAAKGS